MAGSVWAIVPVKNAVDAKQRLSDALSGSEREALFRAMANDVFAALAGARALAGVLVVTRDPALAVDARAHGFRIHEEPANDGHTEAVERGIRLLADEGVATILALPADLPILRAEEVDALVAQRGAPPDVVISPAADELGSNGMLLSPPQVIALRFGDASFEPHLTRAREAGIAPRVVHLAGFGMDIDTPADLQRFLAYKRSGRARDFLDSSGITARLGGTPLEPQDIMGEHGDDA